MNDLLYYFFDLQSNLIIAEVVPLLQQYSKAHYDLLFYQIKKFRGYTHIIIWNFAS